MRNGLNAAAHLEGASRRGGAALALSLGPAALLFGTLLPIHAAHSKEPLRLMPSSPWNVHYSDESCRIGRHFGEDDQRITFTAISFDDSDALRFAFVGKSLKSREDGKLRMVIHPSDRVKFADYYPAIGADNLPALILIAPQYLVMETEEQIREIKAAREADHHNYRRAPITPEQETAISHIELSGRFLPHVILETGSFGKVMEKMRDCRDQLLTDWGLDAAKHRNLSERAQPLESPGRWLRSSDYPMHLVERGQRGIVHFRLMVDEKGDVSQCKIQQSTRPAEFDDVVCKALMRRAKFSPARDSEGNFLPSYYRNNVRFML